MAPIELKLLDQKHILSAVQWADICSLQPDSVSGRLQHLKSVHCLGILVGLLSYLVSNKKYKLYLYFCLLLHY